MPFRAMSGGGFLFSLLPSVNHQPAFFFAFASAFPPLPNKARLPQTGVRKKKERKKKRRGQQSRNATVKVREFVAVTYTGVEVCNTQRISECVNGISIKYDYSSSFFSFCFSIL